MRADLLALSATEVGGVAADGQMGEARPFSKTVSAVTTMTASHSFWSVHAFGARNPFEVVESLCEVKELRSRFQA